MARKKLIFQKVTIEKAATDGKCLARIDDRVVFVAQVAPGDVVDLKVTRKKKNYLEAIPIHFHHKSELRITPFCPYFGTCGGCKWQHLDYPTQLKIKEEQVRDQLERIGKLELPALSPILGSEKTQYYRNKLEFTFSNRRWLTREEIDSGEENLQRNGLGFHVPGRFDKVLDIRECFLQPEPSNEIRNYARQVAEEEGLTCYDLNAHQGELRNLIVRNTSTGEIMVIVQFGQESERIIPFLDRLRKQFPALTSLQYIINTKRNETYFDQEVILHSGKDHVMEEMTSYQDPGKKLRFRIGPKSFYQTNSAQAEKLYRVAADYAALTGDEVVYDLYTGTGTIANYLAGSARRVVGIESVPMAIDDARINAELNGNTNTEFHAGDMRDLLTPEWADRHERPDVVITDPPRAGMHKDVIDTLMQLVPRRIVYISCNPATQARDLELLSTAYKVEQVQPLDMFPHTHHVENVVSLTLQT